MSFGDYDDSFDGKMRRYYTKKASDHVTEPPRFYLTTLFIFSVMSFFALLVLIYDLATNLSLEIFYKIFYLTFLGGLPLWVASFYIPYNQESSKAPVGITRNASIFTFRLEDISALREVMDESEDGMLRQTVYFRWLPMNAVPGWPYAYGGGHRGYLIMPQGHVRYGYDNDSGEWHIDNAWSLNKGDFITGGMIITEETGKDGEAVKHMVPNRMTTSQIVNVIKNDKPYREYGQGKYEFPYDDRPITLIEVPDQLIGTKELPKGIRLHSRFKESSPLYMAWDLAPEQGGPGMNLPSHAEVRFGANERVTKEQSRAIIGQRTTLTIQEKLSMDKKRNEYDDWEREHT